MNIGNEDIRLYLIKKGFGAIDFHSDKYILKVQAPIRSTIIEFGCDLRINEIIAKFPDYAYNDRNPYSTKDCIVRFRWTKDMDKDTIIANIEQFFDKIISMNK